MQSHVEQTVVHELLHLLIDPFFNGETRADICAEEWAVEQMANALIAEHRRKKEGK